jgi:hypothetical protein
VPGPRQTLYAAGAELLHIFPVSISTHGLALNITVQSYRDQLDFGFIAGANITVSNVPGPRQTLYAAGAELLHIFPVSISTHGLALNITVQSYRDQLDFGFIAGANIIPHVQVLCDMLPLEFEAMEAAFAPPPAGINSAAE